MPLSSIVKKNCTQCGKVLVESSRIDLGTTKLITYTCGHVQTEDALAATDYNSIISSDNRRLMPFQIAGVKFLEACNARALLADEQGLGKTVQAAALIKLHLESLSPIIIVTKTTVKLQWMWELIRWTGNKRVQVLNSSKEIAVPGFDIYVTTYDLLKDEKVFSFISPKTLVLDEVQAIKNHLSGRAKAVQNISKQCEHVIALSGTPIKNNAGEYFTVLNVLQPSRFPEYQRFLRDHCDYYDSFYSQKIGGLKNPDSFHERTKDFILRRTKSDVLSDLPELNRRFHHVELNREFNKAYAAAMQELDDLFYSDEQESSTANMIAIMTKMRQITGISKVTECVDYLTEFLLSCDRKIAVFVHHHAVASLLEANINKWLRDSNYPTALMLSASLDGDSRSRMVKTFEETNARAMIASTLAAGEGLNLQFCSDAIMLERQWNPANEEQAEARFHRFGQKNPVSVTYMLASETIDDYFTELVEQKRSIVASTLDNKVIQWESSSLMKELASILVTKGKKKWTL